MGVYYKLHLTQRTIL